MNKIKNYLIGLVCVLMGCLCTACSNDDLDTNQYKGGVSLNVFGPSPVMRGGELRFIGSGMDQVTAVVIPGCAEITDIKVISENEIRVTVPQDAEPGLVTLKSPKGDITTLTQLTFEEPIELDGFTPNPVKPGKQLTLTGDYLNLIKSVIFTDGVAVDEDAFVQHDRKTIVLTVPAQAQTGQIILSDATSLDEEDGVIPNYIYSEDELAIVLPSASAAVDLTAAKPGDIIEIVGTDLDLVQKIVMPSGEELEFNYVNNGGVESIIFTLPVGATDGAIVMIPASGVKVAIANLGMALPEQVVADPASELREGDQITLKGVNMELVTDVTFPGVAENVAPDEQSATEVKVTVPAGTVTGDILLNTASGTSVSVAIQTQKPEFIAFAQAEVSLGNDVVIQGKNLDLVTTVKYTGGASVEVKPTSATELTVSMPTANAESGVLTLVMANGESVVTEALTITLPEFCYVTELPDTEETEIKAGGAVTLPVANSDVLTGVQVNGQTVQYILTSDNQLIVGIPQNAGKGAQFTLVSSNGSITYTINVTPATEVTTTLWTGLVDLASWSINYEVTPNDMFVNKDLKVGDKVRIYGTTYADWWQIQLYTGHWAGFSMAEYGGGNNINVNNSTTYASEGYLEFTVDDTLLNALQNDIDWGYAFIIQGEGFVVSKITLFQTVSFEQTLWKGEQDLGTWSINWELPADLFSSVIGTVSAGQTLRIYGTPTSDWWQVQLFDGHWGGMTSLGDTFGNGNNVNSGLCDLADGCITINVTAEMAELFNTYTDWGYCGIIQGENFIVTKITIE
jgi:hypothetical protein